MSAIFVSTTKTTQPRPQVFPVKKCINLQKRCIFDVISSPNTKFFQMWSSATGYGELCVCFEPIRIGEIFWMNNNFIYSIIYLFYTTRID